MNRTKVRRLTMAALMGAIAFILMLILLAAMALMKRGTNKRVYGGV